MAELSSDTVHASCVAIDGRAVLLSGRSGVGKSDLALRLIDRGAALVSDDYSLLTRRDGRLYAAAPATIAGKIEVRGIGIVEMGHIAEAEVALIVDLEAEVQRMPDAATRIVAGVALPVATLSALEASAPIKVEMLLRALPATARPEGAPKAAPAAALSAVTLKGIGR